MEPRRDSRAFVEATLITVLVIVVDQLSKAWMQEWLAPPSGQRRYEIAGDILAFEYLENRGAAFGLFVGQSWLLTIGAVVVGIGLVGAFREELRHSVLARTGLALIVGGGTGNLIDRVVRGYVVDFVAVGIWPKFNVADSGITIGLGLLLFHLFRDRVDHHEMTGPRQTLDEPEGADRVR